MPKWMMVLNDGTTYTELDGCSIVPVPEHLTDANLDEYVVHADAYYCFDDTPPNEITSNNGMSKSELDEMDEESHNYRVREDEHYEYLEALRRKRGY